MRLLVVFALTLCVQVLHAKVYTNSLSWDSVANQEVLIPENYTGTANLTLYPLEDEDVVVCVNWLVPAEAPEDVNLAETWNVTCQYAITVLAGTDPVVRSVALRANINYVSAALINEDADSDGNSDETFDFSWELSYDSCPSGSSGPSCTSVVDVDYSLIITANAFTVFRLPTLFDKNGGQFLQYISFSLPTAGAGAGAEMDASDVLISYRLNGPVTTLSDGNCTSAQFATCIPNPPFYSASETYWEISVSDKLSFQIIPIFCSDGRIGADCKTSLIDFENEVGVPLTRTGPASFVFYGSDLSVAVGALDGYTQQSTAPSLVTQLDALPVVSSVLSSGINSKANRLSFSLANIGATDESRYVVTVQAGNKDSYAIWIVPNSTTNQCPENCSNHGNCIDFVCECEEDYNGIACEHEVKTFTIEYIILIAVGGLLVLSIVIGVPIYCWMNRQQDYETIE